MKIKRREKKLNEKDRKSKNIKNKGEKETYKLK